MFRQCDKYDVNLLSGDIIAQELSRTRTALRPVALVCIIILAGFLREKCRLSNLVYIYIMYLCSAGTALEKSELIALFRRLRLNMQMCGNDLDFLVLEENASIRVKDL